MEMKNNWELIEVFEKQVEKSYLLNHQHARTPREADLRILAIQTLEELHRHQSRITPRDLVQIFELAREKHPIPNYTQLKYSTMDYFQNHYRPDESDLLIESQKTGIWQIDNPELAKAVIRNNPRIQITYEEVDVDEQVKAHQYGKLDDWADYWVKKQTARYNEISKSEG